MMASWAWLRNPFIFSVRSFCAALSCFPFATCRFCSAVVMFVVVFFFAASRSLAESCGEICGGAGFAGVGSAVSVGAGRRGAVGRLAGAGGGTGDGTSGAGSSVVVTGGGVSGGGIGEASSGGGVLTDGGAALTMCLLAHPTIPAETAQSSARR